ncbi:hypothetical protein EJB05_15823, partial [Eragrostis curvula]
MDLVFVQSDVFEVAENMRQRFDGYPDVLEHVDCVNKDLQCDKEGWLLDNTLGIRTEREIHAELEGATIYRRMYQKTRESLNASGHQKAYSFIGSSNYTIWFKFTKHRIE